MKTYIYLRFIIFQATFDFIFVIICLSCMRLEVKKRQQLVLWAYTWHTLEGVQVM